MTPWTPVTQTYSQSLADPALKRRDRVVHGDGADVDAENVAVISAQAGRALTG